MRSHIGWGGERNFLYKGVETSPSRRFKNLEENPGRESPKSTISASGVLGPLQMVSELERRICWILCPKTHSL